MEYKCINCGGELHYDPSLGKLKCDFCESVYDLDQFENGKAQSHNHDHEHDHTHNHADETDENSALAHGYDRATDDSTDVKEDLRLFSCPHCGAEVVTDKDTVATSCVFCQTPMVIEDQMSGSFTPDKVIPFEVDKKQIEQIYEDYIRDKPFYPDEYATANVIEKIKGVYLPFWLYNLKANGQLHAQGERTATFTTGKWIVTNHDVFDIYRKGNMGFAKIPSIASSKTPREAMDALEPFDYSKMKPFDTGYLPGFLAQRYDVDEQKDLQPAAERARNTLRNSLSDTIGPFEGIRILNDDMQVTGASAEYALLPSYLLFMDYDNDEDKLIAINGQTGKIAGNIPVDARKKRRYFLKMFLIWAIVLLVILFAIFFFLDF